jgi:hypothetical protein
VNPERNDQWRIAVKPHLSTNNSLVFGVKRPGREANPSPMSSAEMEPTPDPSLTRVSDCVSLGGLANELVHPLPLPQLAFLTVFS